MNPNTLHRWRREFRKGPGNAFPGLGKRRREEGRVAQLERKVRHAGRWQIQQVAYLWAAAFNLLRMAHLEAPA